MKRIETVNETTIVIRHYFKEIENYLVNHVSGFENTLKSLCLDNNNGRYGYYAWTLDNGKSFMWHLDVFGRLHLSVMSKSYSGEVKLSILQTQMFVQKMEYYRDKFEKDAKYFSKDDSDFKVLV